MVMVGFTGLMYTSGINSNSNTKEIKNNTGIEFNASAKIIYLISFNGNKTFVTSNLNFLSNNYIEISVYTSHYLHSKPYNKASFIAPISDFEFYLPAGNKHQINAPGNSKMYIYRYSKANFLGLVSSSTVKVLDGKMGINSNLHINIISVSGNISNFAYILNKDRLNNKYYFFIPQLIPNLQLIGNNKQISYTVSPNVYSNGSDPSGSLKLTEKDNTVTGINVYYLKTYLDVSSFSSGGWKASISAKADSSFDNWRLLSSDVTCSINSANTEVTAHGIASFYGVFPLGIDVYWYATPTVNVHVFSSGKVSGNINDPIITETIFGTFSNWGDDTVSISNIVGCSNVIEYIVT